MDFNSPKELYKFMRDCAKLGVTRIKLGEIQFELEPSEKFKSPKRNSISPRRLASADDIEAEGSAASESADFDLRMAQLVVDDFEAYEDMSIRKIKGEA